MDGFLFNYLFYQSTVVSKQHKVLQYKYYNVFLTCHVYNVSRARVLIAHPSCVSSPEIIEERGDAPLRVLLEKLGGWPVLDPNWNEEAFDWIELVGKLRLLNNRVLINQWVGADDRNSKVNIIQVGKQPIACSLLV